MKSREKHTELTMSSSDSLLRNLLQMSRVIMSSLCSGTYTQPCDHNRRESQILLSPSKAAGRLTSLSPL